MNLICNKVPVTLKINGRHYKINTDFRVWIQFELLLLDSTADNEMILNEIQKSIFIDKLPFGVDEAAADSILWFYRCGKSADNRKGGKNQKSLLSYDYDDGYIYAAFLQQYDIDLNSIKYLHWWKFKALFQALPDDTMIVKIMSYRAIDLTPKMSAEERSFYQKMKRLYAIPLPKSEQEKYSAIEDALIAGNSIDDLI